MISGNAMGGRKRSCVKLCMCSAFRWLPR